MIDLAGEAYPNASFICHDMVRYLASLPQQSVDVVIGLASLHHITTTQERLHALHQMYRVLKYDGKAILINWSWSYRFLRMYRRQVALAGMKSLVTLGDWSWNDLVIPWRDPNWKENNHVYQRYYHLFTLSELQRLMKMTNFLIDELTYTDKDGFTEERTSARNSFLVVRKGVGG
jgi:ubiquinone/menaquinone biosynthesis C-methylase UbiE